MSASNYVENKVMNHIYRGVASAAPAAVYVQLHTGNPGEDGTDNIAGETGRELITFAAAVDGVCVNDTAPEWLGVAASETYAWTSLWDAAAAGNCLGAFQLASSKAVLAGDDADIAVGDYSISLT